MKPCRKCNMMKPMEEFYRHPYMADGRLNTCKTCHKNDVRSNYAAKREEKHAYDAERYQTPERKASVRTYQEKHRQNHPSKCAARSAVARAKRSGALVRCPCEVCGRDDEMVEAHHEDYAAKLDVRWLCFACHRAEHGHIVTAEDWRLRRKPTEP